MPPLIPHARAIGTAIWMRKRCCESPRREYRVHVGDEVPGAPARDDVVTDGLFGGKYFNSGTETFFNSSVAIAPTSLRPCSSPVHFHVDQPLP